MLETIYTALGNKKIDRVVVDDKVIINLDYFPSLNMEPNP